jgi:3-hydroxyacyl-[acyl-carrier protein] dehydratase/trans-2-decenoyl-[acyl-carrier protein] isomerase
MLQATIPSDDSANERLSTSQLTDRISSPISQVHDGFKMMLPQGEMKMLDRVVEINSDGGEYQRGELIAEFDIDPELWFFKCHFPGDPIMPGCLGIDALWQALGLFLVWNGHEGKCRALGVKDVQFYGEILPTVKTVRFHVHVKRVVKRGMTLVIGDGYVFADGKEIYSAKHLKAALI